MRNEERRSLGLVDLPASDVQGCGTLDPVDLIRESLLELEAHPLCLAQATVLDQIEYTVRELFELSQVGIEPFRIGVDRQHAALTIAAPASDGLEFSGDPVSDMKPALDSRINPRFRGWCRSRESNPDERWLGGF